MIFVMVLLFVMELCQQNIFFVNSWRTSVFFAILYDININQYVES